MRRAISIQQELSQINTVEDLTEVFESIASIKISKVRNSVIASKEYFGELWQAYRGLRVDRKEQLRRTNKETNGRTVFIAITAEGKLSGEVDSQVIDKVVEAYQASNMDQTDVIVLGAHGASQLEQNGVVPLQVFHLPEGDAGFSVSEVTAVIDRYEHISVFYQTYESLRIQRATRIELVSEVRKLGDDVNEESEHVDIVSSHDFIFEPGIEEIADFLESLMLGVALTQVVMETKLAQYAGRFNAMNSAKRRAREIGSDYSLQYHRAKRSESDERLKETVNAVRAQTA